MHALIVAATSAEISVFLKHYRQQRNNTAWDADILISGPGIMAATYALTRQLALKRPSCIIQAGIAGCFVKSIATGTVLAVRKDCVADQGVIENNEVKTFFSMGLLAPDDAPYVHGWLPNNSYLIQKTTLQKAAAITVNEISSSPMQTRLFKKKFRPVLESMEGAALHYVCRKERIPFLQLRSVSNYAGERNKKKWDIKNAISNLNQELITLMNKLHG